MDARSTKLSNEYGECKTRQQKYTQKLSLSPSLLQFVHIALNCRHLLKQQSLRIFDCSAFNHGRPQAWERGWGTCPPPRKCCKMFCALVVTVKRSEDQLFMHYFHNFSSASGGFCPRPPPELHPWTSGIHPWTPPWTFVSRPPNLPTPWRKSCGCSWLLHHEFQVMTS